MVYSGRSKLLPMLRVKKLSINLLTHEKRVGEQVASGCFANFRKAKNYNSSLDDVVEH